MKYESGQRINPEWMEGKSTEYVIGATRRRVEQPPLLAQLAMIRSLPEIADADRCQTVPGRA